jgi:CubicO group peptidase (beta-lactamase class C family)
MQTLKLKSLAAALAFSISLSVAAREADTPAIDLQPDTLEQQIDTAYRENGFAGVLYIYKDGEVLLAKAYGYADPEAGRENTIETIFGIGSRPIDFTVASIYLLAQRDQLSLDDTLGKFYPEAPEDRANITIRHMMNGQSGFPDFPADASDDWDADLAWISREEFEQRSMKIDLLFEPGEGEAHSHWAFGILAAIVERVSGVTYEAFLKREFFDPAGMIQTGNYGERGNHALADFAVGGGQQIGLPNIPPNWGPTSWLVKGSGGMYSSLGDLLKFYKLVSGNDVLEEPYAAHFRQLAANVDGSERGFELFSFTTQDRDGVVFAFFNRNGAQAVDLLARPMIRFLRSD